MKTYTIDDILAMEPCQPEYNRKNLERLFAGKKSLSPFEILRKRISIDDKIWVGLYMLTETQRRKFACWCALQVSHLWDAPKIVIQYLKTQDESIMAAANAAAWDAAWDAVGAAARAAANAAAWAAAKDCAWAAAKDAAKDAAWAAARAACRKKQLTKIRRMLRKENARI